MDLILSLLAFVVTVGLLVGVHEYGHLWVAQRLDIRVLSFSIGFGKALFSWRSRTGVDYVLRAVPLGGYVRMLSVEDKADASGAGEGQGKGRAPSQSKSASGDQGQARAPEDIGRAFEEKAVWRRALVAVAGPMANFIFAIFALWLLYLIGITGLAPIVGEVAPNSPSAAAGLRPGDQLTELGEEQINSWRAARLALVERAVEDGSSISYRVLRGNSTVDGRLHFDPEAFLAAETGGLAALGLREARPPNTTIDRVVADSAADRAGMLSGDRILAIDGQPLASWRQLQETVAAAAGESLRVRVERAGLELELAVVADEAVGENGEAIGRLGVAAAPLNPAEHPQWFKREALGPIDALVAATERTGFFIGLTFSILRRLLLGRADIDNLSGPVGIARMAGISLAAGFESFVGFLALISISLGIFNLLPVPVLDGGHLLLLAVEAVRGRQLSARALHWVHAVGLSLLFALLGLTLFIDIGRLFS